MNKIRYFLRQHCGGLKESLETTQEIEPEEANKLLEKYYKYYGYDERVNQQIYILKDMQNVIKLNMKVFLFIGTKRDIETYLNEHETK